MKGGWWTAALTSGALALSGCGGSDDPPPPEQQADSPAKSEPSNTRPNDGPRVGDGDGGVRLEQVGVFDQPVYVTADPTQGGVYVVEQCGVIQHLAEGAAEPEVFLDISDQVTCGGEQGLLSVAFDPLLDDEFRGSGLFYVYFTDLEGDARIVEFARSEEDDSVADSESARELLRIEDFAANHNGGQLQFGPEGSLYIGTGDGGGAGDPERTSQDLTSLLGKILRIDPSAGDEGPYTPEGAWRPGVKNPPTDDPDARPEVLVRGLRNPWRFSFDQRGDLWIGDVGQSELEEIDAASSLELDSGLNFGWSAFEGTQRFNEDQHAPDARDPILQYGRDGGCSVTGGYVVRDPKLRALVGRYLYGDYCAGELRSFTADPERSAVDDRPLGLQVSSLSSFGRDAAGRIYVTSLDGPVFRLAPARR